MSLKHAELKAARALQHLQDLKREIEAYYARDPVTVTNYLVPELGRRVVRLELKDLSDTAYLLVGDFTHNLRCVLDHIIYALVVRSCGRVPQSRNIQWPVQVSLDERAFSRQTNGIPKEAIPIVRSFQPYDAGTDFKRHPLWQLHMLDVVDKHRRLTLHTSEFQAHFSVPQRQYETNMTDTGGEVIFPIDVNPFPITYERAPRILFGASEEGLSVSVERFEEIYSHITQAVLPKFAPFF